MPREKPMLTAQRHQQTEQRQETEPRAAAVEAYVAGEGKERLLAVRVPDPLLQALKQHALSTRQTQQAIVIRVLEQYLQEHGRL